MPNLVESPAYEAGREALEQMYACLDGGQSFRLEAGAGAGKTYSLEKALSRLIDRRGTELIRQRQQVACITYTNVAKDEIISRFQAHPAIRAETVHGFCWSLLKDFQVNLRGFLGEQPFWSERFEPVGGIGARVIHYEMGYRVYQMEKSPFGMKMCLHLWCKLSRFQNSGQCSRLVTPFC